MLHILITVLPVMLMLFIGWICRKRKLFTRQGIDALKNFVVNIALSAVLVNAFATMEYSFSGILIAGLMFLVCVASWALGVLFRPLFGSSSRFIPFLTSGFEAGMLGYALFTMLYGTDRIFEFARLDLGQVLFVFTLYKILLGISGGKKVSAPDLMKEMFTSPTILAILAGILIGATGLHDIDSVAAVLDACTDFVSAPTSAVILLTIGYDLVFDTIPWKATLKTVFLRLSLMGVLRILLGLLLKPLGATADTYLALNIMLILPPPFVISVFTDDEEQQSYLSAVLTVSTLVTLIGFVVLVIMR